jgi:sec-independent protein translocase protein TatB
MFYVGFWEMLLLCALGLVVLGPDKLPKIALSIGNYIGRARSMVAAFTRQMRQEIELTPNRPMSPKENKESPAKATQPEEETKEEKTDPEQSELWNQKN